VTLIILAVVLVKEIQKEEFALDVRLIISLLMMSVKIMPRVTP